jgi:hypothetical protein
MNFRLLRLWPAPHAAHPGRDVVVALTLKALLLLILYLLFFGPSHRVTADAHATAEALLGAQPAKERR